MSVRPRAQQSALKPFMAHEGEGGAPAQSDSGGASFLGQVRRTPHPAPQQCDVLSWCFKRRPDPRCPDGLFRSS